MNALQPSRPSLRPVSSPPPQRMTSRRSKQRKLKRQPHQAIAFELGTKVVINSLLIIAAASTLFRLVPYHRVQQAKLHDIQSEVSKVEGRVTQLRSDFSRQFDPQQTMTIMQEQSNRINPNQRRIVWTTPINSAQESSKTP